MKLDVMPHDGILLHRLVVIQLIHSESKTQAQRSGEGVTLDTWNS